MESINLKLTRRQMIKTSLTAGSVLVLGFHLPGCNGDSEVKQQIRSDGTYAPNAWVTIDKNDTVTIMVNHSEMGQGVLTALPMILAEEMDADWSKVKGVHAPVADVFKNPMLYMQATGGSTSVRTTWEILRLAGATVRLLFINAAAAEWNVSVDQCYTENGRVMLASSQKQARYGMLIDTAAKLQVPETVRLKNPSQFKLIGKEIPRLDTHLKLNGSAVFGIDVNVPGMLIATVVHSPVIGGKVELVDDSATLKMPGVKRVLIIQSGVAVVADTFWQALKGKERLQITWSTGNRETADTDTLKQRWQELAKKAGSKVYEVGDTEKEPADQGNVIERDYELPFQAHATQEPMNCTADVREEGCDIWVPTQTQGGSRAIAALMTGLKPDAINIHTTFLGGGFGRRAETDFVQEAVAISQALKKPVKLIWTREEDITADFYRPASLNRMRAVLNRDGKPSVWTHRMVGMDHFVQVVPKFIPALMPSWFPRFLIRGAASIAGGVMNSFAAGKGLTEGAGPLPYSIPNVKVEFVNDDVGIPVGFWRSVANSSNGFVVESFIDELAYAASQDPYRYRFDLLAANPRLQNTLQLAAEKSGWGKPAANGAARGITAHNFHDTLISMVAEVTVSKAGEITIHRIVCAVDCGQVINPKIIRAQIESGVVFGLTATLKSSITFTKGRSDQQNFDSFQLLRLEEMPVVETYIVDSNEPPTGIGEVAVPVVAPAVTNAVFAATGKRLRKLPIRKEDLFI